MNIIAMVDAKALDNATLDARAEMDADLASMNSKYAVVRVGGKVRVVSTESSPAYPGSMIPVFSTITDFKAFHDKYKKMVPDPESNGLRKIGIGTWWIQHEERRQFDGIVYAPNENTPNMLNLWTGFGCKPKPGDCSKYIAHLFDNICAGNTEHFDYMFNWMAYAVQHPGRQGEVAVVLRGREGVGKGVAVTNFGRLFGAHFKHISNGRHLTGHFNAHLQHCSVLYADEAFFAGDRTHESSLKALITERTLLVEPKGLDSYQTQNCIHLLMSSNSEWVVPAGADARRYFVLDCADTYMQDTDYFAEIAKEMDDGGREALLHQLLHHDLAGFEVRKVPQTAALADQKTRSRRGVDRLVEIVAHAGVLPAADSTKPNVAITTGEDRGEGFYPGARSMVPDLKFESSIVIAGALSGGWGCKPWHSGGRRGITFPALEELRAAFDRKHGRQEWTTDITTWGAP